MRRVWLLTMLGLLGLGAISACDDAPEENPTGPGGSGEPGIPDDIVIARTPEPLVANGVDGLDIFVTVVDGRRRALPDIGVSFTTSRGSIVTYATTDADGIAQTRLLSAASATDITATVTATTSADSAGAAPDDARLLVTRQPVSAEDAARYFDVIRFRESQGITSAAEDISAQLSVTMLGVSLTLKADPGTVPADGASTSRVAANLVLTTSRVPLEGESVQFGATVGAITGRVSTDPSGSAVALLTSTESGAVSQVTAFYGNLLTAQTQVTFSALTLSLTSGVPGIADDGSIVTPVTAHLINAQNNPVSGVELAFTTNAGTITSPAVTGPDGTATAQLRTASAVTQATVTASFGALAANHTVTFSPLVFTVSAASPSIRADGTSSTAITARLATAAGDAVPGVRVRFTTDLGTIDASEETGEDGRAVATLTSGTAPGEATVTASYAKDKTATTSVEFVSAPAPSQIDLSAEDAAVLADGLASTVIAAVVTDPLGNPPPAGTAVSFTTTRGVLDNVLPTDASGRATARLKSTRFQTGTARVGARLGDLQSAVDVKFVSEAPAQIVVLEVTPQSIGVRGSGTLETSVVTYEVRDANGIPVDADHAANLAFRVVPLTGEIDATVHPGTAVTDEDGAAITTVQAGDVSGAIELEARSGSLESKPIRIAIHGGLPDPAHFSVSPEALNIAGLVFDGIQNGITARVGDVHGNPVPLNTAVWFSAEFGLVQGSAFTDDHGEATVWEITAAPRPVIPGGDGLVTITAQTVSAAGDLITTSTRVMWSGPTIVEILSPQPGFVVPNGGSVQITFRVRDANNNPLTGGTRIVVASNVGDVAGTVNFTLPDTQSQAYTTFTAVLLDDDPEDATPTPVTVELSVASVNGQALTSVTGFLNAAP